VNQIDRQLCELLRKALADPASVGQGEICEFLSKGPPARCVFSESRASGRMGAEIPVRLAEGGARVSPGRNGLAREVGIGGLRVTVPGEGIEEGTRLRLLVERPAGSGTSELEGRVVWSRKVSGGHDVGICLANECSHCWFATLRAIAGAVRGIRPGRNGPNLAQRCRSERCSCP
jgi:hypothetical protein